MPSRSVTSRSSVPDGRARDLREHDDAGEALREGVVEFARHAFAFGHHPARVLGLGQLRAGGLELSDEVRALARLVDDPARSRSRAAS
jgi:hypothetical protein